MNKPSFEYFCVIAECGQITRAASLLHVSQQTLSSYLKRLETNLGVLLFSRDRQRQITLTVAGKAVYEYAKQINNTYAEIELQSQKMRNSKALSIACPSPYIDYVYDLLPLLEFAGRFPETKLLIQPSTAVLSTVNALKQNAFDFIICGDNVISEDLLFKRLYKEVKHFLVSTALIKSVFPIDTETVIATWMESGIPLKDALKFRLIQNSKRTGSNKELELIASNNGLKINTAGVFDSIVACQKMLISGFGAYMASPLEFESIPLDEDIICLPCYELSQFHIGLCTTEAALNKPHNIYFWEMVYEDKS